MDVYKWVQQQVGYFFLPPSLKKKKKKKFMTYDTCEKIKIAQSKKFYWHTTTIVCLCITYDCFLAK